MNNDYATNTAAKPQTRRKRHRQLPGLILSLFLLAAAVFFCWQLYRLKFLPPLLFAALAAVLFLLVLLVYMLSRSTARRGRFILAVLLTLILGTVFIAGSYVCLRFSGTVKAMFRQDSTETVVMEIYVRADDSAQRLSDLRGETLGILTRIDRSAADEVLQKLAADWGKTPAIREYNSPIQLLYALSEGQIRAILMNEHYFTFLEEGDAALSSVRALHSQSVVITATTEAEETPGLPIVSRDDSGADTPETKAPDDNSPAETTLLDSTVLSADGSCFIAYISGIDSREGLVSRARTDVNILAAVNPDTRQIVLISTPRDCAVLSPVSGDQPDTLTYTGNYGIDVSRKSLETLYNLKIDYWFRLDFGGFVRIIDALGGIDVNSDQAFHSGSFSFHKGVNHLNGEAALAFSRERKAFGGSDQFRGPHQMEVIRATLKKAASSQILSSWDEVLSAVSDCFEMTLPYDVLAGLVRQQLILGGDWNIVSYSLDGTYDIREIFSLYSPNYMFLPKDSSLRTARELIWTVLNGGTAVSP